MMNEVKHKLTLDRLATYQIKVPGQLDESRLDWGEGTKVVIGCDEDGQPVTSLTATVDQAGLHGLLRRLYSLGLPLISVIYVACA
jgi:hypothetical protein